MIDNFKYLYRILFLSVILFLVTNALFSQEAIKEIEQSGKLEMPEQFQSIINSLNLFRESKEDHNLTIALNNLISFEVPKNLDVSSWKKERHTIFICWLKLIATVDEEFEANYDSGNEDPIYLNISPLEAALNAGIKLDEIPREDLPLTAGMSPEDIQNPIIRKAYGEALAKNKKNAEYQSLQHHLRRLDRNMLIEYKVFLEKYYSNSNEDIIELQDTLNAQSISVKRKDAIKELMGLSPTKKGSF